MRSRLVARAALLSALSVLPVSLAGCSSEPTNGGFTKGKDAGDTPPVLTTDSGLEIPSEDGGVIDQSTPIGTLKGTTYAPDGNLELPGAAVYLTPTLPSAEPRGAVCDACVNLTGLLSTGTSKIDGTFEIPVFRQGKTYLVVEKGRFRRVREITIKAGDNLAPAEMTTIPGTNNPRVGDYAPKILVIPTSSGSYDKVQDALTTLNIDYTELTGSAATSTLKSPTALKDYAILFLPCGTNDEWSCSSGNAFDTTVKARIKDYVASGGRLYVTDYAYEYVRQNWPSHITWANTAAGNARDSQGAACNSDATTRSGTWEDPGLKQWMGVVGNNPSGESIKGIYTTIDAVRTVTGYDPQGNAAQITPKVWVKANGKPSTVTFPDRCGRVLFSTNHTEGGTGSGGLLAQEKAIIYTLLEVSTCINGTVDK